MLMFLPLLGVTSGRTKAIRRSSFLSVCNSSRQVCENSNISRYTVRENMYRSTLAVLGIALVLVLTAMTQKSISNPTTSQAEATGLIIKASPHSVQETTERLTQAIESKGLRLFATIDHSENAAGVELELPPTQVIMFGNPNLGTPLMQCNQSIAIDLPQKMLIWQDQEGVKVAYNNPVYLAGRHHLNGCGQPVINRISGALDNLSNQAIAD